MVFTKSFSFGLVREIAAAFAVSRPKLLRIAAFLVMVLLAASCSSDSRSTSPLGIGTGGKSSLRFAPRYSSLAAGSSSAPINTIHLVARIQSTGVVVGDTTITVNPDDAQWVLPIDLNLSGRADVVVLITLINVTNGVAETQWSGQTPPITVTPGVSTTDPTPLVLYRGPPENLTVTAVHITRPIPPLTEGGDVQLAATVEGGGPTTQVFWTALDGSVATISGGGLVHSLSAGTARFVASAGPRADTVAITVAQRIASVAVTPSTLTLESFGAETDFTARVLDPRGAVIPGAAVVWRTLNAGVAQQVSGARFRAVTNGLATIEAAAVGAPTVVGQAALTVSQRVATVQLTPPSATLNAVGATVTFTPVAKDANGNVVAGAVFTFSSSVPAVATVTNGGVARAVTNGATNIQATTPAGGAAPVTATVSATAALTVLQSVARIEVSATPDVIDAIGGTSTAAAVAKDASGNTVAGQTFVFSSTDAGVLSVNATTGAITAVGRGMAYVRATSGGVSGNALVSVEQRVTLVSVAPTTATASYFGQPQQFVATPRDRNRNPVPGRTVTWSSSAPAIASVHAVTGLATALTQGTAQIIATVEGVSGQSPYVVAPRAQAVIVTPNPVNIPTVGGTQQFVAVATDSHSNLIPGAHFTWSSSNTAVLTINATTGLATAVANGSATVTARADSASGNAAVTVGNTHIVGGNQVLLLYDDGDYAGTLLKNGMVATGVYRSNQIDQLAFSSAPPLTALTAYGCIIAWTNYAPVDPAGVGDVLKRYVDAGGRVVLMTYSFSPVSLPWEMQGGIMQPGYSPFVNTNTPQYSYGSLNFTTALTSHPIMSGVTEFSYGGNNNYNIVTMDPGATRIGNGPDGNPVIGVNSASSVVGIGVYPGGAFSMSPGVFRVIANACAFTTPTQVTHRARPVRPESGPVWIDPTPRDPDAPRASDGSIAPIQSRTKQRN